MMRTCRRSGIGSFTGSVHRDEARDRDRDRGGAGLGLAIVADSCAYGGSVHVGDNAPGARVTVTLPGRRCGAK